MENIERFLADHHHEPLVAGSGPLANKLGRLCTTLWQQWRHMYVARCNHSPSDRNTDMETLAKLGKIVEATGMDIVDVLLVSGCTLEAKLGVDFPTPTMSKHVEPPATIQRQ
jgi:hypothetical protein